MIEKDIIKKNLKEFEVMEYIENIIDKPGYGFTEIQRTPLGEKIIIHTSKPGLIVGRKGVSIRDLTEVLKIKFGFENPQIEVNEINNPNLNPHSIAKHITHTFQRFGPSRFKFLGYKLLEDITKAGAQGAEIIIHGRGIPGSRSKLWRFSVGHLKKSGDISENFMKRGFATAHLKSGAIGVKVSILTPDVILPDTIDVYDKAPLIEEIKEKVLEKKDVEGKKEEIKEEKKSEEKEKKITKKTKEKKSEEKEKKITKKIIKEKKNGNNKEK